MNQINARPNLVTKAGTIFYVEFDHGHGYLHMPDRTNVSPTADIVDLYVVESHRGQGLGRMYLAELLRIARAKGAKRVVAHVKPGNVASLKTFDRAGFESSDETLEYHMELEFAGCAR